MNACKIITFGFIERCSDLKVVILSCNGTKLKHLCIRERPQSSVEFCHSANYLMQRFKTLTFYQVLSCFTPSQLSKSLSKLAKLRLFLAHYQLGSIKCININQNNFAP